MEKLTAALRWLRCVHLRVYVAVKLFFVGRRGVTTLEYGLIAVAVIGIVAVGVGVLGGAFKGLFQTVSSDLGNAAQKVQDALT